MVRAVIARTILFLLFFIFRRYKTTDNPRKSGTASLPRLSFLGLTVSAQTIKTYHPRKRPAAPIPKGRNGTPFPANHICLPYYGDSRGK